MRNVIWERKRERILQNWRGKYFEDNLTASLQFLKCNRLINFTFTFCSKFYSQFDFSSSPKQIGSTSLLFPPPMPNWCCSDEAYFLILIFGVRKFSICQGNRQGKGVVLLSSLLCGDLLIIAKCCHLPNVVIYRQQIWTNLEQTL